MKYLFLHPVFPGQLHSLIEYLAAQKENQVVHCCQRSSIKEIKGVRKITYQVPQSSPTTTHPFVQKLENCVYHGETVLKVLNQLKKRGFSPDLIYGYAGWGPTLFLKDLFPHTPLICYFEWFLNPFGSEYNFERPLPFANQLCLRIHNSVNLLDLQACDRGLSPTHWQKSQLPRPFHDKISVIHDGVDTNYFRPAPDTKLILPEKNLDLSEVDELITYIGRGLEPFRGFPQFMRALDIVLKRRPRTHAVVVGSDAVFYSRALPPGQTYRQQMLAELNLDLERVHFTGLLPYNQYLRVLQASSAHVYLTYPYVLSWSLMEAMACGCAVIGSDTPPVREVIENGANGFLVDFFSPEAIAAKIEQVLDSPPEAIAIGRQARKTIVERYDRQVVLPQHLKLLEEIAYLRLAG